VIVRNREKHGYIDVVDETDGGMVFYHAKECHGDLESYVEGAQVAVLLASSVYQLVRENKRKVSQVAGDQMEVEQNAGGEVREEGDEKARRSARRHFGEAGDKCRLNPEFCCLDINLERVAAQGLEQIKAELAEKTSEEELDPKRKLLVRRDTPSVVFGNGVSAVAASGGPATTRAAAPRAAAPTAAKSKAALVRQSSLLKHPVGSVGGGG